MRRKGGGDSAGEQFGWHSFRRAFANRLHRAGVAIRDAQDLGGWKNLKVLLDTYLLSDEEAAASSAGEAG